jgi:hypothetical protein
MPKHIVHTLHDLDSYEIRFYPVFQKSQVEYHQEVTVHGVSASSAARDFPVTDETPDHLLNAKCDVFLLKNGHDAWPLGSAAKVIEWLEEFDVPVPEGLLAALEAEPNLKPDPRAEDVTWDFDLLAAESYKVYAAVFPAIGDDWDFNECDTLEEAIEQARPAYYSGPAQVQIGSIVVRSNNAHGGTTNGQTDSIEGQTRKIWEHPALSALKEREANRSVEPAPSF